MPVFIPPIAIGILKLAGLIAAAYEGYELSKSALESIDFFEKSVDEAKKFVRERLEEIKKEIDANIDEKMELAFLVKMADTDAQSKVTKKAEGRGGAKNQLIIAAIKQKIPFRQVIGAVCAAANKMPMITLRRDKNSNIKPSDVLSKRRAAMKALLMLDELTRLDKMKDVEGFITVRLKQLVASIMFEFMDEMLDWASPLKTEVCFGPRTEYLDPILDGGTRLKRTGTLKKINPFFPPPRRGDKNGNKAIVADLVIPDYRKQPTSKNNIFAIVEIKFPNDTIENEQFENYDEFSKKAAKTKTEFTTLAKTRNGLPVSKGCRISLFRFPEDVAAKPSDDKKTAPEDNKKPTSKPTTPRKPGRRGGH
jgi:hypothetical protein